VPIVIGRGVATVSGPNCQRPHRESPSPSSDGPVHRRTLVQPNTVEIGGEAR